jgi:hypothetical protein
MGGRREPGGGEDRRKLGKELVWRKQKNAAKHRARLRGWWASVSNGDASQMHYFLNGTKGYRLLLLEI